MHMGRDGKKKDIAAPSQKTEEAHSKLWGCYYSLKSAGTGSSSDKVEESLRVFTVKQILLQP